MKWGKSFVFSKNFEKRQSVLWKMSNIINESANLPKVVFIIGQTASGKSDMAVQVASVLGSIVVCADAYQVYREFSVASDKILRSEMKGVRHFGLDILDPGDEFNVKDFLEYAVPLITSELACGRSVVVIGGTHMYIEKLLFTSRIDTDKPNSNHSQEKRQYTFEHLREVDPKMAMRLHPNDVRRWSRAIDFYYDTESRMSEMLDAQTRELRWKDIVVLEKRVDEFNESLEHRIKERIEKKMLKNDALKNELLQIKSLVEEGKLKWRKGLLQAIGYKEFEKYLSQSPGDDAVYSEQSFKEAVAEMTLNTVRYSKKQSKWLKKLHSYLEIFEVENFESDRTLSLIHAKVSLVKRLPSW